MKRLAFSLLLLAALPLFGQSINPLVGTWKMISGKMTRNDTTETYDMNNFTSIKIVTPTHFAVFAQGKDSSFLHAVGGTVTADKQKYVETVTYGNFKNAMGKPMIFTYELAGNRWHTVGGGSGYVFDEIWERVQ